MFALMSTAILGAVALVVDIGQLYLARRHLQNVADQAVLVGAQRRMPLGTAQLDPTWAIKDARIYADANGVNTDPAAANHTWHPSADEGVRVDFPPVTGNHVGDPKYLEVTVAKRVPSLFAGILGQDSVRIEARAVATGFGGSADAAIIALKDDPQAIKSGGSSHTQVLGSIYSRGSIKAQSGFLDVSGFVYARGTINGSSLSAMGVETGVDDITDPGWPVPPASSSAPGTSYSWKSGDVPEVDGWRHIYPGTYKEIQVSPGHRVMFHSGVYHVDKTMKIQGIAAGEQPLPIASPFSNGNPDVGEPVCIVLRDSDATFEITADGTVRFRSAETIGGIVTDNLVIRSLNDHNAVKIVGTGNINLYGTIYAPMGDIQLAGSSGGTVNGQVIGGRVELLGGTGPAVIYDPSRVPATRQSYLVE